MSNNKQSMKYRLEIKELNNGDINYIPQVDVNSSSPPAFGIVCPRWHNLANGYDEFNQAKILIDESREEAFKTEEDAILLVEAHKKQYVVESAFKVKKVTYKEI